MTLEEKLKTAIDFIKLIETYEPSYEQCENIYGEDIQYIDSNEFNMLKDKAWHVLADLTD